MKKMRESNIEFLRLLSMFLIIMHHSIVHGVFNNINQYDMDIFHSYFFNFTISNLLIYGGKVGVGIFIIISGYFATDVFKIEKVLILMMQTFTYSILGLFIGWALNKEITVFLLLKSLLPIIYSQYWFVTTYVVLLLFSPYIIKLINLLTTKIQMYLLILLININLIIPTFLPRSLDGIMNNLSVFILLFITGYFIKIYNVDQRLTKSRVFLIFYSTLALYFFSVLFIEILSIIYEKEFFKHADYFSGIYSPLVYITAISLFIICKKIRLKDRWNNVFNSLSRLTFGVYLIHDNIFIRKIIWNDLLNLEDSIFLNSIPFVIKIISSVTIIYLICLIIELARFKTLSGIEHVWINKISGSVKKAFIKTRKKVDLFRE